MPRNKFDVLIVGAGPAGIFAALELSQQSNLRIAILDKGPDIDRRHCPARDPGGKCRHCQPCAIMSGWGGAGAFSDGKLTLSPAVGGRLAQILGQKQAEQLIEHVDDIYVHFGAPGPIYGIRNDAIETLEKQAAKAGLSLYFAPVIWAF